MPDSQHVKVNVELSDLKSAAAEAFARSSTHVTTIRTGDTVFVIGLQHPIDDIADADDALPYPVCDDAHRGGLNGWLT